jgi:hypothetical protein
LALDVDVDPAALPVRVGEEALTLEEFEELLLLPGRASMQSSSALTCMTQRTNSTTVRMIKVERFVMAYAGGKSAALSEAPSHHIYRV